MDRIIHHFCHDHPLILTENMGPGIHSCYACNDQLISEAAYVCSQKDYCSNPSESILHKRCAELPRQITHSAHPGHPLRLFDYQARSYSCTLCGGRFNSVLRYRCSGCHFNIDISCRYLDLPEKKRWLQHPSHHHPLALLWKPASFFSCDACGTVDWDMEFVCSMCDLSIHNTCALLPIVLSTDHHHHKLSLEFYFPIEHRKHQYRCEICGEECPSTCWVYYCRDCKYFAHVKCATSEARKEGFPSDSSTEESDGSSLIQLPIRDFSKELIAPFVIREKGVDKMPDITDMPTLVTMPETMASFSLLFNYHKHPSSLVLKAADDDDDELVECDVCATPIYSPPYYNCATCKYFLHSTCCLLPKTLVLDTQIYGECPPTLQNHKLTVYTSSEFDNKTLLFCHLCQLYSNGMFYKCEDCQMQIDVKCASLPTTIKHATHQHHKLTMKRRLPEKEIHKLCACGSRFSDHYPLSVAYYCANGACNFALDLRCALLPQSIKDKHDKHPLLLTYDASTDHPTDFYCQVCEEEMHPKRWMYYCRECDNSFSVECLTRSGFHRNVKFGREFEFGHLLHPHPLAFDRVTLKIRCDICHKDCYSIGGFQCELCNYALCFLCGVIELGKM